MTDFDITSISSVDRCAQAAPMDVLDIDGKEIGIQFLVIGAQADAVQKYTNKIINAQIMQSALEAKSNKPSKPKQFEETIESNNEAALVRVVGWVGVKQKFERDVFMSALKKNPHWVGQIIDFSNDLRNFTKAS